MKFIYIFLVYCSILSAQEELIFKQITDDKQVKLFNRIELLAQKNFDTLAVRIHAIDNESGSAGFPNCEVSTNIYIAISGFDEFPDQNLFILSSLYSPKILRIVEEKSKPTIYLSFIKDSGIKCLRISASLKNIQQSFLNSEEFLVVKSPSVVFFHPTKVEIEKLNLEPDSGFNEVISDFEYYSEKIKTYLIEQNIKPIFTSAKIVIYWNQNHQPKNIFRNDLKHPVGIIITDQFSDPYIFEGVLTDVGIKEKVDTYFKIKN